MKAQTTAEYMVLISMVIAYSIILIYAMIRYIDTGVDASITESQTYWANKYPIAIKDWRVTPGGDISFIMENKGLRAIVFYNMTLDNETISDQIDVPINSEFTVNGSVSSCEEGSTVEYSTVFIYYKIKGLNQTLKEGGEKPIKMICQ